MDPRVEVVIRFGGDETSFEGDHAMVVCGNEVGFTGSCSARTGPLLVPKALGLAKDCLERIGLTEVEAMRLVLSSVVAWGTLELQGVETYKVVRDEDLGVTDAIREMAESLGVEVPDE